MASASSAPSPTSFNFALYLNPTSTASWRVRLLFFLKKIPFELKSVTLMKWDKQGTRIPGDHQSSAYAFFNPLQTVPVLVHRDVGLELPQSLAIFDYIHSLYPDREITLLPKNNPVLAAQIRALALYIDSGIHPLQNLSLLDRAQSKMDGTEASRLQWAQEVIEDGLKKFQALVEKWNPRRPPPFRFCIGDAISWADLFLIPQLGNARRYKVALDAFAFPRLLEIELHVEQTYPVACKAARPESQPDYVPPKAGK